MSKEYNPQLHHRQSVRLRDYDYTTSGAYFITLVTHLHSCLFGKLSENQINLNQLGKIAASELLRLENRFSNLTLDCWGMMPNHLHVVIVLRSGKELSEIASLNLPTNSTSNLEQFGKPVAGSIPTIIRSYKSSVTKRYHEMKSGNPWQRGFYEHIVRSETELNEIRSYIENNPSRWIEDKEYRDG